MSDTVITIQGEMITDVSVRTTQSGYRVARFRVATTPRRPGRSPGEWIDGPTSTYAVTCWRALADNVGESLKKGQPVIVHGRLTQRTYGREVDGQALQSLSVDIDALTVGPDLAAGVANFRRMKSQAVRMAEQRALADVAEVMAVHPAGGSSVTNDQVA
jgi:single-strand DNA-binding protein